MTATRSADVEVAGEVRIVPLARRRREVMRFLRVPYSIYQGDPNWVAPLLSDVRRVFSDQNPLFEHATMQLWVAQRNGRDVGRIAGIIDQSHNTFHSEKTAFFGFFEAVDDAAVAEALFATVRRWAHEQGMERILGPMNPTTNDECGLLVEGFDAPPVFMMTYNPAYYAELFTGVGLTKAKDLLAYYFDVVEEPLARMERLAALVQRRSPEIRVRSIRKKQLRDDLAKVKEVYNQA